MHAAVADLLAQIELERLEINLFRGSSRDIGSGAVFGGQVLGQALRAAYATAPEGRLVHSLHAYFLRRGDFRSPIVYEVDRSRDGHGFSSRRVIAIQHGEQIFHMAASFQVPEEGVEHHADAPAMPPPESLPDLHDLAAAIRGKLPPGALRLLDASSAFEFRPVDPQDFTAPQPMPPRQSLWLRAVDRLPDDPLLHHALLAYVSDYHLIGTAMRPHALTLATPGLAVASIDHAMWFHRPLRVDDWLLYTMDSPSASGGRGLARASLYPRDGRLVASTAQEGLIRRLRPPA
jgi:acyl-CoA thioesterase II